MPLSATHPLTPGRPTVAAAAICLLQFGIVANVHALQRVTRDDAVAAALATAPRATLLRADSAAAYARVTTARQWENPTASASYSKAVPSQHYAINLPLDFPWLRGPRIGSADAAAGAARWRYQFDRAALGFEADTAYTRALAAASRAELSRDNLLAADSLVVLARLRRDAGDGTDLDVQLAEVNAGQLANRAADDSLERSSAVLAVQALMGLPADRVTITLADSLGAPPPADSGRAGEPLLVAVAADVERSAELAATLERRRVYGSASFAAGFETGDPSLPPGVLPTIGIAIPFPVFNRNSGAVQLADAERERARAGLALARIEVASQVTRARRALTLALARVARDRRLLDGARRVSSLSLLAYREGAAALPSVLEAHRTAREALATYIDDVAAAHRAAGLVKLLTLTATRTQP